MVVQALPTTLRVNPAFLQEIKDSNTALWQTLEAIRSLYASRMPRNRVAHDLVRLLDDLRDHLALQFALEEAYGYLELPVGAPVEGGEAERAGQAQRQHCSLYLEISELCERAEELQYRGLATEQLSLLLEETQAFEARFQSHEALEHQFIRGHV